MKSPRAAAIVALLLLLVAPAAIAALNSGWYADSFNDSDFTGNSGTLAFATQWVEIGEQDGPESGEVVVGHSGKCAAGPCLQISGHIDGPRGATRAADLSGTTSAVLRFSIAHSGNPGGVISVRVSPDGGNTWRTVGRYDRHDGHISPEIDITDLGRRSTVIAFRMSTGSTHTSYVDDVQIAVSYDDPPRVPDAPDGDKGGPPDHAHPSGKPHATTTTTAPPPTTTTTTVVPVATDVGATATPSVPPRGDVLIGIAVQLRSFAPPEWTASEESAIRAGLAAAAISEGFRGAQALREDLTPVTDVVAPLTRPAPGVRRGFVPTAIFGALLAWATITGFERRRKPATATPA